jgi:glycosyltransferase involved in cell wall biosynthesis
MEHQEPLVSVLMTAYNRRAYIGEAIESVLNSTYQNFELIVVDDYSTDATPDVARSFQKQDSRIRLHVNEQNIGDYPNRNRAAEYATGKYLKYLDSDDVIYPHGLAVMVDCMERFPDAGFGLSEASEGRPHPRLLSPEEAYRAHFFSRDLFGRAPGSSIMKRSAFEAVGGFSGIRQAGDFEFWLKIAALYPLVTMPRDLVWDRVHTGQEQHVHSEIDKDRMRWELALAAIASDLCPFSPEEKRLAIGHLKFRNAKRFWRLALRHLKVGEALRFRKAVRPPLFTSIFYRTLGTHRL